MAFSRPFGDGSVPSLLAGAAPAPASTISHEIMSDGVLAVARALPLTHVVTLLKGMWLGWAGQTWPQFV